MNIFLLKTENGNNYLHSSDKKEFLVVAPILNEIINCYFKNGEIEELKNLLYNQYDKVEVDYYYEYFSFLKAHKYLTSETQFVVDKYKSSDIEYNIANINQIIFETTQSCNLNCAYCGFGNLYEKTADRKDIKMQFATAKAFLDYMFEKQNSSNNSSYQKPLCISFYGGYERKELNHKSLNAQ